MTDIQVLTRLEKLINKRGELTTVIGINEQRLRQLKEDLREFDLEHFGVTDMLPSSVWDVPTIINTFKKLLHNNSIFETTI